MLFCYLYISSLLFSPSVLQSPSPSPPHCHRDEEEEDLNKAFDVQGFQQILCLPAHSPPEKHRVYDERDFEGETLKPSCRDFLWWFKKIKFKYFQEGGSGSRLSEEGLQGVLEKGSTCLLQEFPPSPGVEVAVNVPKVPAHRLWKVTRHPLGACIGALVLDKTQQQVLRKSQVPVFDDCGEASLGGYKGSGRVQGIFKVVPPF